MCVCACNAPSQIYTQRISLYISLEMPRKNIGNYEYAYISHDWICTASWIFKKYNRIKQNIHQMIQIIKTHQMQPFIPEEPIKWLFTISGWKNLISLCSVSTAVVHWYYRSTLFSFLHTQGIYQPLFIVPQTFPSLKMQNAYLLYWIP